MKSDTYEVRLSYQLAKRLSKHRDTSGSLAQSSNHAFPKAFWDILWTIKNINLFLEGMYLIPY